MVNLKLLSVVTPPSIYQPDLELWNNTPTSVSSAYGITFITVLDILSISPLDSQVSHFFELLRKISTCATWCIAVYENTISLDWNIDLASGFVAQ